MKTLGVHTPLCTKTGHDTSTSSPLTMFGVFEMCFSARLVHRSAGILHRVFTNTGGSRFVPIVEDT